MSLVIALAITTGFRSTLQGNLLRVTAHVSVLEKDNSGIENWRELRDRLLKLPHVVGAAPALFAPVYVTGSKQSKGIELQGIDVGSEPTVSEALRHLKAGSLDPLKTPGPIPGIILGSRLAQEIGKSLNDVMTVTSPQGTITPYGVQSKDRRFRVVGIFESGFYDFDVNWAYTSLAAAQQTLSLQDEVNSIELRLDNPDLAPQLAKGIEAAAGPGFGATTWIERNRPLFHALEI